MGGSQEACVLELVEAGLALPWRHPSGQDPNSQISQTLGC